MKQPPLRSFRVENFKAIRESGSVDFGWLTVFIGNNGVGKSSLTEALETFRDVVIDGVDAAFQRWRGFEHVWNKAVSHEYRQALDHRAHYTNPLTFALRWHETGRTLRLSQHITKGEKDSIFIQREQALQRRPERTERWTRNDFGDVHFTATDEEQLDGRLVKVKQLDDGESMLRQFAWESLERWQFLMLDPDRMGQPTPQQRATSGVKLARDGANVAEYLNDLREHDLAAFEGVLSAVRSVLPYATDLQPTLTSELERAFYLKMKEASYEIPGWLLSTGTLRIVALLACLRHPNPPPVLIVEEIENGLDPRTLHLVVEEIRAAISAGTTQVIATTHSPFLLDLLDLSHVVVVERVDGQPRFWRPEGKELAAWSKSFSPGQLYTMDRLTRAKRE